MSTKCSFPVEGFVVPHILSEITDPPKQLYIRGSFPSEEMKFLTVVGSRKYTPYGRQVCEKIISGLRGYPVVIISGLALGIDAIAHRSALETGLATIAVPGSGLDDRVLYPATNRKLAKEILDSGGALISEFEPNWKPRPESFPQRNRIMAGLSHAVLVIEAEMRSGTLITSRLATEYNRDVFAIPGPIHSKNSEGPHMLIQKGAMLIKESKDILDSFNISIDKKESNDKALTSQELKVKQILVEPLARDELIRTLNIKPQEANVLLSSLEIKGLIKESVGCVIWLD
jgi:DNA processing protein